MPLLSVKIEIINGKNQRYPTCGDWFWLGETLIIRVSDTGNVNYNHLIAVHEYVEALLCREKGVSEAEVTKFDIAYEEARQDGDFSEPGNNKKAPYYEQHQVATEIEKRLAEKLGVDWETYEKAIDEL